MDDGKKEAETVKAIVSKSRDDLDGVLDGDEQKNLEHDEIRLGTITLDMPAFR